MHLVLKDQSPLINTINGNIKWPSKVIASLSHKKNDIIFAKDNTLSLHSVGIDLEEIKDTISDIEHKFCSPIEQKLIDGICSSHKINRSLLSTAIFSFKEAIYKCHFPLGGIPFYFLDVTVTKIDPPKKELIAQLHFKTSNLTPEGYSQIGTYFCISTQENQYVASVVKL